MRTVESLGYLDELEKQFDDPSLFKAVCGRANAAARASGKLCRSSPPAKDRQAREAFAKTQDTLCC